MSTPTKAIANHPFDTETTEQPFGKRWGGQTITLNPEDLQALQNGKYIALDVMSEYVVYIKLEND
ncbi:MAG: hypothetical protein EOP45_20335 [Sphingobacteriaceae bacterium]|nr:MAG: hypothetical protein EOP45_20335 [Sphingobacteriaceae bacterium]